MANQKPAITGAIRFKGQVYKAGDEEAFSKVYRKHGSEESLKALVEKGVIAGIDAPVEEPPVEKTPPKDPGKPAEPKEPVEKTAPKEPAPPETK